MNVEINDYILYKKNIWKVINIDLGDVVQPFQLQPILGNLGYEEWYDTRIGQYYPLPLKIISKIKELENLNECLKKIDKELD